MGGSHGNEFEPPTLIELRLQGMGVTRYTARHRQIYFIRCSKN